MSKKSMIETSEQPYKTLLLGIYLPGRSSWSMDDYFSEFENLAKTSGVQVTEKLFIKLRSIHRSYYLTKGKLNDLIEFCEEHKIDRIISSVILTPVQQRNMEDATSCEVIDRSQLILEIFRIAATTAEGKIQVEMAEVKTLKARMAGTGKELDQQAFGTGSRGPGEKRKEKDVRYYKLLVEKAQKKLATLKQAREVQRKRRLNSGMPLVCFVGYTNAGKSSLLNTITKSEVLVEDKLFATLDTTTRELFLEKNKKILISDTVGFISDLPHDLVEAFRSTLDELRYANMLLHVIDVSNSAWEEQAEVVGKTLDDLKIDKPVLHVFNKVDKLSKEELKEVSEKFSEYLPSVVSSALAKDGISDLRQFLIDSKELWPKKG
jgi:GTPase